MVLWTQVDNEIAQEILLRLIESRRENDPLKWEKAAMDAEAFLHGD